MSSPTDGRAAPCPVCAEPLLARPPRCFRCETALGPWWELEDALGALEARAPTAARPSRPWAALLAALAAGVVLGAASLTMVRPPPTREAAAPAPPPPLSTLPPDPLPAEPRPLDYRVQRGDSLWRIAAAVTGEGHRWRELWPEHAETGGRIATGTVLPIDLARVRPDPGAGAAAGGERP